MEALPEIDVTTAAQQLQAGALLLDVREPDEIAICSIPGGRHIPMREIPASLAGLPRDRPILVLCHHGSRSRRVTQFLHANGFDKAANIAGGIEAWAERIDPGLARY